MRKALASGALAFALLTGGATAASAQTATTNPTTTTTGTEQNDDNSGKWGLLGLLGLAGLAGLARKRNDDHRTVETRGGLVLISPVGCARRGSPGTNPGAMHRRSAATPG